MWIRPTALAVCLLMARTTSPVVAAETLTLDTALQRTVARHPDLRVFGFLESGLAAEVERAALAAPLVAGAQLENAAGSGELSGLKGAELTLSLASVLERGGKREARRALAASRFDALAVRRVATQLDLLADVAQRYLELVAAQAEAVIATDDLAQRERAAVAAMRRLRAGAAPESVQLTAEAMRARAALDVARAEAGRAAAWRRLQSLWGASSAASVPLTLADPLRLPEVQDYPALRALLERSPELRRFADETRIREARLHLAQSSATADVSWQFGLRSVQTQDSWAVVAGATVPLGSRERAGPEIAAARSERNALDLERESEERRLDSLLAEAHGQFSAARVEVRLTADEVLPRLVRAEAAAERAYRAGALSYLDWAQLQKETSSARRQQLAAAIVAHRALIEIQRLTGEPLILPAATSTEFVP
jgi:cobalt-zinc-cadmium efflux system outer membrane protein